MKKRVEKVEVDPFAASWSVDLEAIAADGVAIIWTRGGRAIARIDPVDSGIGVDLRGSVLRESDLIGPVDEPWRAHAPLKSKRRR